MRTMDGFSAIWRDLATEPVWEYEELPPFLLSQVTESDLLEASESELARAIWFWLRRPKLRFRESAALMIVALCVLISLSIALLDWPGTSRSERVAAVTIVLFEVAVVIYAVCIDSSPSVGDASTSEASIGSFGTFILRCKVVRSGDSR
jgi:hypothetical protein